MTRRTATCSCRALSIATDGEPVKVSACHCVSCQKRTGSAFGVAVFFPVERTVHSGQSRTYIRPGDSGQTVEFHFCPTCATTLFWYPAFRPAWVGIAIGCFDEPGLRPTQAVYEHARLDWASITTVTPS